MLRRGLVIGGLLAAGGLLWIMDNTAPATTHPLVVLVMFAMLYMLALAVLTFFIFGMSRIILRLAYINRPTQKTGLSFYKSYIYASVIAFAPVVLLAMRTVGQESITDFLLVVLFEILACFYVWRQL